MSRRKKVAPGKDTKPNYISTAYEGLGVKGCDEKKREKTFSKWTEVEQRRSGHKIVRAGLFLERKGAMLISQLMIEFLEFEEVKDI